MPELPEVESYRRLAETAIDRPIASVSAPDAWFLKGGADGVTVSAALVGNRFTDARRIGKLLLLDTEAGPTLGLRFGMTGTLVVDDHIGVDDMRYVPRRVDPAWDRFSLRFDDGGSMAVRDPRRLGGVALDPDVSHLGPDAASISTAALAGALRGSKAPLKARLLDQSKVAGVGNLIADEVLWRAGLSPLRASDSLEGKDLRRLHRHLGGTLEDLMTRGGSHLGDLMEERHPGGRCPKDGCELVRATVGGRTSWWCPKHQH
jgi:formamidopyrimidine-DNA glycosylase